VIVYGARPMSSYGTEHDARQLGTSTSISRALGQFRAAPTLRRL
jgi:hypothetical protein